MVGSGLDFMRGELDGAIAFGEGRGQTGYDGFGLTSVQGEHGGVDRAAELS